jgi:hypothetical protein
MAKVALSKTPDPKPSKAKVLTHIECNTKLESIGEGLWLCPRCHKTGHPVKIRKVTI